MKKVVCTVACATVVCVQSMATAGHSRDPRTDIDAGRFVAAHPQTVVHLNDGSRPPSLITALQVPVTPGRVEEVSRWVQAWLPVLGVEPLYGNPVRMQQRGPIALKRAPRLGEHTREVLESILGFSPEALDRLDAKGVLS